MSSEKRSMISGACAYMKSDAVIAGFYDATLAQVAAIRRSRPQPRPMMQHEAVGDASVDADTLREDDARQRCAAHLSRLWAYYEKKGARLNVTASQYGLMAMETGVSKDGLARARLALGV